MKNNKRAGILVLIALIWICKPIPYEDLANSRSIRQEVLRLKGGGQGSTNRNNNGMKILLEKLFPDWPERVDYQKKQEKVLQSGRKKLREGDRLGIKIKLTPQEQDAFDYFHGTGFYESYQNPKTLPNIFDTRQSFLLKIKDPGVRTTFLNSSNNRSQKEN